MLPVSLAQGQRRAAQVVPSISKPKWDVPKVEMWLEKEYRAA
jgi:hypothetical protein